MDTSDNSGVSPSLITLFFSQQHQQQQQQSKDGASASTQKQLQKQYIQQFLESQESPLDNINSVDFKKYMYQLMINQLRSDGFVGAASAIANATMLPLNSELETNLTRLSELVHAGIQSEKEKLHDLVVPEDTTAKMKHDYDETKNIKNATFVTRFITTHKGSCRTAKFTRDGKYVVTGSADCSLKLLDVEKMHYHHQTKGEVEEYTQARPVIRTFYDHTGVINDVDFHPMMPIVVSAARDNTVRFFDYTKASIKRSFHVLNIPECEPRTINMHPSGDFMLIGTSAMERQSIMRMVDLHSMKTYSSSNANDHHTGDVNDVRWSTDGKLWVSGGKDCAIKIWDGVTGRCVNTIPNAHSGHVYSVQFSLNNNYLLSNGQDSVVKLWDLSTGRQIRTFKGPSAQPSNTRHNCCFNFNENAVISSRENEVLVWDTVSGDMVHRLNGHNKVIRWIAYSPTEQSFVSCSDDQRARFWADEKLYNL